MTPITALLICFIFGNWVIRKLESMQIGETIRSDGPEHHKAKAGTPTMGGVLIVASALSATLLWADLTNRLVWLSAGVLVWLGIVGFLDIPLIHYSTRLWRGHHPEVVRGEEIGLPPDMKTAFFFCVVTFLVLFGAILWKRVSLEMARDELESLKAEVRDRRTLIGDA